VLDGARLTTEAAATTALHFLRARGCRRLNVAGPRASGEPRGYDYAYAVVRALIEQYGSGGVDPSNRTQVADSS
jgi:hypothetical protein